MRTKALISPFFTRSFFFLTIKSNQRRVGICRISIRINEWFPHTLLPERRQSVCILLLSKLLHSSILTFQKRNGLGGQKRHRMPSPILFYPFKQNYKVRMLLGWQKAFTSSKQNHMSKKK